jgi:Seryl-tRNA synthetase
MSKKDMSQAMEEPMVEAAAETGTDAQKLEEFKQKKREAAKRCKENKAKAKEEIIAESKALIDELKKAGLWDKVSEKGRALLDKLANPAASNGNTQSLFRTLFGDNPRVGTSITLKEAFDKTLKGKSNIDHYVKKWAEKGTIISFKKDEANMINSVYTIEAIGAAAPADAE